MNIARYSIYKQKEIKIFDVHGYLFAEDFTQLQLGKWISDIRIDLFVTFLLEI